MTTPHEIPQNLRPDSIGKRALQGAGVAFTLVAAFLTFLLVVGEDMAMGLWILPPVLIPALGGALGGAVFYLMHQYLPLEGWKKPAANLLFGLVFIAGLWMSMVLGLAIVGLWD
jgi:hypothetical protein